ncbi:DUF1330 domain-containing protein [Reyranella sp.]|uniref:DUF1330 domain-containing protein n=1 Tax=Reyranella sp. TaxID=1929291 RepID=UPI003D10CD97
MPKAYWIFNATITDPDTYRKYVERDGEAFAKYGARFLVRGGDAVVVEGSARARHVIIEFENLAVARACYDSPEYQAASVFRRAGAVTDLIIVEGVT